VRQSIIRRADVICIAVLISAYIPGVLQRSLWSDDYTTLVAPDEAKSLHLSDARPIYAYINIASFYFFNNEHSARFLKFFGLMGIIAIYSFLSWVLKEQDYSFKNRLIVAIALLVPSFQMPAHWAHAWVLSWTAFFGLLASYLWSRNSLHRRLVGIILYSVSIATYPPTAVFNFAAIVVLGSLKKESNFQIFVALRRNTVLFLASSILSFANSLWLMTVLDYPRADRLRIVTLNEIPEKVFWLLSRPVTASLRPFMIDSPSPLVAMMTALPVLVLILLGLARDCKKSRQKLMRRTLIISFGLLFSIAPLIVSPQNQIEFRLISGISWGIASLTILYLLDAFKALEHIIWRTKLPILQGISITALIVILIVNTNVRFTNLFGNSFQVNKLAIQGSIKNCEKRGPIYAVGILELEGVIPRKSNLGIYSAYSDLYFPGLSEKVVFYFTAKEYGLSKEQIFTIETSEFGELPGVCTFDLNDLESLFKDQKRKASNLN